MASSARLRLVDPETGELKEAECPNCAGKDATITTLGNKIVSLQGRLTQALQRADESHESFPAFKRCHDYWRTRCHHPRTKYDIDDFKLWLPWFEKYGEAMCMQAIDGAAFDPYITPRKNGTKARHDGFRLIFRGGAKPQFMEFCNRAPVHLPDPVHVVTLTKAIMFGWGKPLDDEDALAQAHTEATERLKRWRR